MLNLVIPRAEFAGAQQRTPEEMAAILQREAEERAERQRIRDAIMGKKPIQLSPDGEAGKNGGIKIPNNIILAGAQQLSQKEMADKLKREAEERAERQRIRDAIIGKKPIQLSPDGEAGKNGGIKIPNNIILASVQQWYEKDPSLLAVEKAAMAKWFPHFQLETLPDGRLAWTGTLTPGIWKGFNADENDFSARQTWEVMAVYENNHPVQKMGSSVKVFLLTPSMDQIIQRIGWTPHHVLRDKDSDLLYLCTARAEDIKVGETSTTAATMLAMAAKWLISFEMVMTGDLSRKEFDTPGVV